MSTPILTKYINLELDGSIVAYATDYSFSPSVDMIEISRIHNDGAKEYIPDTLGYTISGSGLVTRTSGETDYGYDAMMDNLINTKALISWTITPDVSANAYYSGTGYLTSVPQEGGVGAVVTYSFELQGSGNITIGTTA